jgi:hypothetical protein
MKIKKLLKNTLYKFHIRLATVYINIYAIKNKIWIMKARRRYIDFYVRAVITNMYNRLARVSISISKQMTAIKCNENNSGCAQRILHTDHTYANISDTLQIQLIAKKGSL